MLSPDGKKIWCEVNTCTRFVMNHRWGKTKATGWYFAKDYNIAYCPDHIPDWVAAWRKSKEK